MALKKNSLISQETIQQILSRIDIVDIVGGFVKLKKRGANYLGLCPFHNEKTPSFTVSPVKEIYKCFGCGRSGNTISFDVTRTTPNGDMVTKYEGTVSGDDLNLKVTTDRGNGPQTVDAVAKRATT